MLTPLYNLFNCINKQQQEVHSVQDIRDILKEARVQCCGFLPIYLSSTVIDRHGNKGTVISARKAQWGQTEILVKYSNRLCDWHGVRDVTYTCCPVDEYMRDV